MSWMKRWSLISGLGLLLLGLASGCLSSPGPQPSATPTSVVAPSQKEGGAYRHVIALAEEIGPRPAGSPSARAAAAYIAKELASYGYSVAEQPFTFQEFVDRGAKLEIVSPQKEEIDAQVLRYSAGGQVTAPLIAAGIGATRLLKEPQAPSREAN